jgi:hypothetical protein
MKRRSWIRLSCSLGMSPSKAGIVHCIVSGQLRSSQTEGGPRVAYLQDVLIVASSQLFHFTDVTLEVSNRIPSKGGHLAESAQGKYVSEIMWP